MDLGTIWASIGLNTSGLKSGVSDAKGMLSGLGSSAETSGKKISNWLGAGLLALGSAAVAASADVGKGIRLITQQTGATGKSLEGLGESFRTVFAKVPESSEAIANTMSDINVRTGATGKALEDLTVKVLNLSRITGTDATEASSSVTKAMSNWGVATSDQGAKLDFLYGVMTKTRAGLTTLTDGLAQFGATLRGFGFSFEESTAMLGLFEKSGVEASSVMAGMKTGLSTLAAAGEDPRDAFKRLVDEIKNADTAVEALDIGIQLFGKKGAAAIVDAIRSGKFEVEAFASNISKSGVSIDETAKKTKTFSDSLQEMKHMAELALEPLGKTMVGALKDLLPALKPVLNAVKEIIEAFSKLPGPVQAAIAVLLGIGYLAPKITGGIAAIKAALVGLGVTSTATSTAIASSFALNGAAGVTAAATGQGWGAAIVASAIKAIKAGFQASASGLSGGFALPLPKGLAKGPLPGVETAGLSKQTADYIKKIKEAEPKVAKAMQDLSNKAVKELEKLPVGKRAGAVEKIIKDLVEADPKKFKDAGQRLLDAFAGGAGKGGKLEIKTKVKIKPELDKLSKGEVKKALKDWKLAEEIRVNLYEASKEAGKGGKHIADELIDALNSKKTSVMFAARNALAGYFAAAAEEAGYKGKDLTQLAQLLTVQLNSGQMKEAWVTAGKLGVESLVQQFTQDMVAKAIPEISSDFKEIPTAITSALQSGQPQIASAAASLLHPFIIELASAGGASATEALAIANKTADNLAKGDFTASGNKAVDEFITALQSKTPVPAPVGTPDTSKAAKEAWDNLQGFFDGHGFTAHVGNVNTGNAAADAWGAMQGFFDNNHLTSTTDNVFSGSGPFTLDEYIKHVTDAFAGASPILTIGTNAASSLATLNTVFGAFGKEMDARPFKEIEEALMVITNQSGNHLAVWRQVRGEYDNAVASLDEYNSFLEESEIYVSHLERAEELLNRQLSAHEATLSKLEGMKIAGEGAADDKSFALNQRINELSLAILQAKQAGNFELLASLNLQKKQAEKEKEILDLQTSVTYDPQRRELEKMLDPMKGQEMSLATLLSLIGKEQKSIAELTLKRDTLAAKILKERDNQWLLKMEIDNTSKVVDEFKAKVDAMAQFFLDRYGEMQTAAEKLADEIAGKAGGAAPGKTGGTAMLTPINIAGGSTTVITPLYLDGKVIASNTTRIIGQKSSAYARSGGGYR